MRFDPWLAAGLSVLLAARAHAAGPQPDHQRIHEGTAGVRGLQPVVVGPVPIVGPGKYFLLAEEAPTTRYALLDLQGVHASNFLVPSSWPARAVFGTATSDDAAVSLQWTTLVEPYPSWATEGAVASGPLLSIGHGHHEFPSTRNDGPTLSNSWAGDRAVFIGLPGHVTVSRQVPIRNGSYWTGEHDAEMLAADDTTGSIHHTMLSPDGSKLYVGIDDGVAGDRADVVQLDLATGTKTLLGRAMGRYAPSFGRGPDGVVYVASAQPDDDIDVLGAITQPNALGAAAGFAPDALPLAPGCDVRRGLTNVVVGGMRLLDTDRDGTWDMLDLDNDNDGIPDNVEGGVAFLDSDYDANGVLGWNEANAATCAVAGSATCAILTTAIDPDGDGLPSPDDLDSDGDGLPDLWECGGMALDLDNDGRVDGPANFYNGIATAMVGLPGSALGCGDADDDGLVNSLDLDSDGDGIGDREEASGTTGSDDAQSGWAQGDRAGTRIGMQRDLDGDALPDWLDAVDDRVQDAGSDASADSGVDDAGADDAGADDAGADDAGADDAGTADAGADDAGVDDAGAGSSSGAVPGPAGAAGTENPSPMPEGGTEPTDDDAMEGGGGCSCDSSAGSPAGSALGWVLVALLLRRRPRRARATTRGAAASTS